MLANIKIRHRMLGLALMVLIGLGLYGAVSFKTMNTLKVNGSLYQSIVQGKDLVADILPPPHYIIESYLVGLQLDREAIPANREKLAERLKVLKGEYDERHAFWQNAPLSSEIKRLMMNDAHTNAQGFYAIAFNEFIPALQKDDESAAHAALAKMDQYYNKHRKTIDQVVQLANKENAAGEAHASNEIQKAYWVLGLIFLASLGICIIASGVVSRSITKPLEDAIDVANAVASGNLTTNIEVASKDETGQLMQALKQMNDNLLRVVSQIRTSADTIATASTQIAAGNQDLSSRTEEQASSLQQTASSMEQLTSAVRQNAENANQANHLATTASSVAAKGGEVVSQVVQTMHSINDASMKMADIIGTIDSIAFQTNILALNAAVEAARAGEQGRGFAVVASEVRNLAQRCATAAREIKSLIDDSVGKVEEGSELVSHAGTTMAEIVSSIQRVNAVIGEITIASHEQSDGITQVNLAITQMDQVTQQNAALVEEAAAAAESMQEQSAKLLEEVSAFQTSHHVQQAAPSLKTVKSMLMERGKRKPGAALPVPTHTSAQAAHIAERPVRRPAPSQPALAFVNSEEWETF